MGLFKKKKKGHQEICILTFARSWNTVVATRSLGQMGVKVITGDNLYLAASNFSLYSKGFFSYPDPDKNPDAFIDKLVEVCKKYQAPDTDLVLMPFHTDSFIISANKERFEGIAKLALPDRDKIDLIGNKASLAEYCIEHSINTPKTVVVNSVEEFSGIAEAFEYPAFLKISDSNAAIGLHKVESPEEAIKFFNQDAERFNLHGDGLAILQQAVPGEDYCSTFIFDHGEPRASMTYHNILDYPRKSGMGALRETVDATEMEAMGEKLLKLVKWHGVAEIDFRWDGKNSPFLIEVNPRFWGGLGQSVESGWNYPYMLFRLAVDGHIDPVTPEKKDIKTFNPCLMTMRMIQEYADAKDTKEEFREAFKEFATNAGHDHFKALEALSDKLADAINPVDRLKAVKKVVDENKGAVNELFKAKDPLPLIGLLYPLAVFLKHGKVSSDMLVTGAGKSGVKEENKDKK
jgi:predicted ATP-grasp superfamily ATP-dependent carboligase